MTTINDPILKRLTTLSSTIATVSAKELNQHQLDGLVDELRQALIDIDAVKKPCVAELTPLRQILDGVVDRLDSMSSGTSNDISSQFANIKGGYIDLEVIPAGLKPGSLTVVAGTRGVGKTAFALSIVEHVVRSKQPVAIFSLRQSGGKSAERLLSKFGKLEIQKLCMGRLGEYDWDRITIGLGMAFSCDVRICDSKRMSISDLRTLCRDMRSTSGVLGLVIIDDLQCLQVQNIEETKCAETTLQSIKTMAQELDVPVVVISSLAQQSAKHQERRLNLPDLSDDQAISQAADSVLLIRRDKSSGSGSKRLRHTEVIVAKHLSGTTGFVPLLFDAKYLRFWKREQWEYETLLTTVGKVPTKH